MKEGKTKKARWREGARCYRCESHIVSRDKEWVKFSDTWIEYNSGVTLTFHIPAACTYNRTCIWTNEHSRLVHTRFILPWDTSLSHIFINLCEKHKEKKARETAVIYVHEWRYLELARVFFENLRKQLNNIRRVFRCSDVVKYVN